MVKKEERKQSNRYLSDKATRKLFQVTVLLIIFVVVINILFGLFTLNYKVVRISFSLDFEHPIDTELLVIGLATEIDDPLSEDELWYYNLYGGTINWLDLTENTNETSSRDMEKNYFQRLLLDADIESIWIVMIFNDTSGVGTVFDVITLEVELYDSTEIIITEVDLSADEIIIIRRETNKLLEPLINVL